jgi:hypothetical protein
MNPLRNVLSAFNFRGPDVERLVKGRERIYLAHLIHRADGGGQ